jgi:phenylalanyl-tRNA synthetase beta chain
MKFCESWLREIINPKVDTTTLCDQLTMLGLEVNAATPIAPAFNDVIVGEIVEAAKHPDADRLRVCLVNIGAKEPLNIVCGAPNARAGLRVAVATVGAVLPGNFTIKEAKLRGVLSQGMLCAEDELGLPRTMDGILELPKDAPLGKNLREYLNLDDIVIDVNLTPNRGDCLSIMGVAREVALKNKIKINVPKIKKIPTHIKDKKTISLRAPEACPRYCARIIKNINNQVSTPAYIIMRLTHAGIRSISPVVDILNYVMVLLGQPMHGFDLKKIQGQIQVRFAEANEQLELLNGSVITLNPKMLVIADESKALALAGIMGGKNSEVSNDTTEILVESAFFKPEIIAGRARELALSSESAQRFERGVDPNLAPEALELATQLILEICGGEASPIFENTHKSNLPKTIEITLNFERLEKLLGSSIDPKEINKILAGIGCEILKQDKKTIKVKTPSWRFDLTIPEDLIEEVARVHGYEQFAPQIPNFPLQVRATREIQNSTQGIKDFLCARGLREVITFSFVDPKEQQFFKEGKTAHVLTNPISSDLSEMRLSLIPSLLKVLQYNERRQVEDVRIFEIGCRYADQETISLSALLYGAKEPHNWYGNGSLDFYDLKGLVEALFNFAGVAKVNFKTKDLPGFLHPGQSLTIWVDDAKVGYLGALHPACQNAFDLKLTPWVVEIESAALSIGRHPQIVAISKFPSIRRDLALVVPEQHSAEAVLNAIVKIPNDLLNDAFVFDVYQGEHVKAGHKSVAVALILQHQDHTLVDEEVEQYIKAVVKKLNDKLQITLRT